MEFMDKNELSTTESTLGRVKKTTDLVNNALYTIVISLTELRYYRAIYDDSKKTFYTLDGTPYSLESLTDNANSIVLNGVMVEGVKICLVATPSTDIRSTYVTLTISDIKVQYKAYKESLEDIVTEQLGGLYRMLQVISTKSKEFYEESLRGIAPEVHIIGSTEENIECIESTLEDSESTPISHQAIMTEYHSVVSEIDEASKAINNNTRLEDLKDISETFMATREKLKELAQANASRVSSVSTSIFDRFKGVPLLGKALSATKELKEKTESVQDNIDALFIMMHKQYTRLVEVGEGLQKAKEKQQIQYQKLELLIASSDSFLSKYASQVDIPVRELMANTQIKTSYEKLKKRILKTESAIMGTQASIISLGKDLPCTKSEMTEELALSSLLNSVTDYQQMYNDISTLLNEVVEITSEKTYKVVENLMDLQINDTHTLAYLSKDNQRAKEFATMLTDKSQKLANKVVKDASLIKEIASGSNLLEARAKINQLGYNKE